MEMLTRPLGIQSLYLNSIETESSSSILARCNVYGTKVKFRSTNSDHRRRLFFREKEFILRKRSSHVTCSQVLDVSRFSVKQTKERLSKYRFRTEIADGQVMVIVGKKGKKYAVNIEVSSLQLPTKTNKLGISWGIFKSDSSYFVSLIPQSLAPDAVIQPTETSFLLSSVGTYTLELEFQAEHAPLYLSFILRCPPDVNAKSSEIRSHRKTRFCVPVGFSSGSPAPLGLHFTDDGCINFAIMSRNAENVVLCLYNEDSTDEPALELDLDPYVNRSGDIWHASMDNAIPFSFYGYRCKGALREQEQKLLPKHVFLDPYARIIESSVSSISRTGLYPNYLGRLQKEPEFDWSGDVSPCLAMEKMVVYRLNVMNFTTGKSCKLATSAAGSFSALTEKMHHFKDIGVNAVLLEPVFPFDDQNGPYYPCHFFSPTNMYEPLSDPIIAINSFKEMVKSLHSNGLEVLVEVVFTHTAKGASLKAIDNPSYYYAHEDANVEDGCALNCNYPIVQKLIVDSLRHWVIDFHVDGFCFINASALLRGFHGEHLSRPPLVEAISFDPILSNCKIIADFWDPYDMVAKEIRFPHWKRWGEMNSKYCDDVRNFLRGKGLLSDLATRLCGSGDVFSDGRGPAFSFNFIARNFGLPIVDLVSFSSVDLASHLSWNCGEEGPTNNSTVLERRLKQIRNYLFILFISLGVPVLNMGDECGRSSGGSPEYDEKPFNWNALDTSFGIQMTRFISFLNSLRARRSDLFQRKNFLEVDKICWGGADQLPPRWDDPSSKFLAMTLKVHEGANVANSKSSQETGDLFIAFNAANCSETTAPPPPPVGMLWFRLVDTALSFPGFFSTDGHPVLEQVDDGLVTYDVKPHSCVLFEAKSLNDPLLFP